MRRVFFCFIAVTAILLLASCSATKFVPEGSYLLDNVKIQSNNKDIKPGSLDPYVRQKPNAKWFNLIKTQLYIYGLSGRDSTKWFNKFMRKIGDAPVIYNPEQAQRSEEEMTKALHNLGYMNGTVSRTTSTHKKKLKLTYNIHSNKPYVVRSLKYDVKDERIAELMKQDSLGTQLREGMVLNVNVLDAERQRITQNLLSNGYYRFNKDFINYTADTVRNTGKVDLTLHVNLYRTHSNDSSRMHTQYTINKVNFITDYDVMQSSLMSSIEINDSIHYKNYPIYFKDKPYLRPKTLIDNLRIQPGSLYNEKDVQSTYNYFGRLSALKYTNIRFVETQIGDSTMLNAYILLTKSKHQSVSFEIDGTNSAGDLGAAASVTYQHRNLFKGSERFMIKLRGAYEAISGLTSQEYKNDNYTEYGVESSINFPRFLFPFLTTNFKRGIRATTEFGLMYNHQMRPEFTRTVASASWGYRWSQYNQKANHRFDLLDINYLYMPWISSKFKQDYLEDENKNYILAYNYEDRLIIRMGYMFNYNSIGSNPANKTSTSNSYSVRVGIESAGNVMYALSKALRLGQNKDSEYVLFNIPFAQYLKFDFDFAKNIVLDQRNSLAYRVGLGIAVPYGNADIIPFEKQYFSGGANSVRGWSVRGLGPGSFAGDGNFLNQSGDIKFDANIELRSKLFWKFQGALFIDAGNVWTVRDYESQPGGKFHIDKFYKQIAMSYGFGLRLDFDFFILRFDGGMKALNPVYESGKNRYPIFNPKFNRDFAFHFAVGYPF